MNFPYFFCMGNGSSDIWYRGQRLGLAKLTNDDWQVEFQTLPRTRQVLEELRETGGYAITHVGRLSHPKGHGFTILAAQKALRELALFLSFARGLWTPIVLPVGFDINGNRLWEEWNVPLDAPWQSCSSWFDRNYGQCLSEVYPGFLALLQGEILGKPVRDALYWYLMSNRAGQGTGIDSGIILSHAALERLSAAYLAKKGRIRESRAKAKDVVRNAFEDLNIPIAIPKAASPAYRAERKSVWNDIPEAISKVRNELIHPKSRLDIDLHAVIPTIWNLAQWYIELFILRNSGHCGVYSNRLRAHWVGQVEKVPWAVGRRKRCE